MIKKCISILLLSNIFQQSVASTDTAEKCSLDNPTLCNRPKVICYFTNWSIRRSGALYQVSDIDTNLCTHIIYSFAVLNNKTLTLEPSIPEIDIGLKMYEQVTALKSKSSVKVLIALGGWLDSGESAKYSRMINNGASRTNFVHDTVGFLKKHSFDGIDLDWEYPKCWQGNCTSGPNSDRQNFGNLVRELRKAFAFHKFLLSVAVSADKNVSAAAYDRDAFAQNLDWIGIMTYDFNAGSYKKTGHHSPYMGTHLNSVDSVQFWLDQGVPAHKLVLGIPLYGRSFTLLDENIHGIGAPATIGKSAEFTKEDGYIAYFEFCSGWQNRTEPGVGSYAFKGDQWVSYNDVSIIRQKSEFIKQFRLAGALVWALDLDDFSGQFCGQGKYPLLTALRDAL